MNGVTVASFTVELAAGQQLMIEWATEDDRDLFRVSDGRGQTEWVSELIAAVTRVTGLDPLEAESQLAQALISAHQGDRAIVRTALRRRANKGSQ
jgi:hypothetical protein